jgi:hypothetical protein
MHNQESQVHKWLVKRGSILLFGDGDKIHLELDNENSESCLLTEEDTEEVISIMTSLAGAIWDNPDFVQESYGGKLYKTDDDNGLIYWELEHAKLYVGFNENEDAVEMKYSGDPVMKVPVNCAVEIIQIMTHYFKRFGA